MGVNWQSFKWITWLAKSGLNYGNTLTLGRHNLYMPTEDIRFLCAKIGMDERKARELLEPVPDYADNLFKLCGATRVDSMDASDFEGATVIHDLNRPVPRELHNRFDVVYDGGTLEHVFNFPEGLRSAMSMVKVGGSLIIQQCFNNMVGHGFYCFGPEVFYRALSPENGFEVLNARIFERYPRSPWRMLPDPKDMRERVRLIEWGLESEILVHARRVSDAPIFERWPQQSDYQAAWTAGAEQGGQVAYSNQTRLGVKGRNPLSAIAKPVLKVARDASQRSAFLGRFGKYFLNARNFSVRAQRSVMCVNDPLLGGSRAVMESGAAKAK